MNVHEHAARPACKQGEEISTDRGCEASYYIPDEITTLVLHKLIFSFPLIQK